MAQVGVCSDAERPLFSWSARTQTSASLSGAQNEFVSFQICVAGPCVVSEIRIAPFGPFQASNIHVFTEYRMPLTAAETAGNNTGSPVPFIMVPRGPDDVVGESRNGLFDGGVGGFQIASGQLQPWWVDLHIPDGATPGDYSGQALVSIVGQTDTVVPITVHVWHFRLPSTSSQRSYAPSYYPDIRSHFANAGTQSILNNLASRFAQLALDHRYSLSGLDTGDISYTNYVNTFSGHLNGTLSTQLVGARWTTVTQLAGFGGSGGPVPSLWGGSQTFVNGMTNGGWLPRFFAYVEDECGSRGTWSNIPPNCAAWNSYGQTVRCLDTDNIHGLTANNVLGPLSIVCPIIEQLWPPGQANDMASYMSWLTSGAGPREVWTYQSLDEYQSGWTQYTADADALQIRMYQWIQYMLGVTGELFFCATYSMGLGFNPFNGIGAFAGNGGSWFAPGCATVSPTGSPLIGGSTDIPLSTFLLKQIRQGMQDLEYGRLLDQYNDTTMKTLGAQMFPAINSRPTGAAGAQSFLQNRLSIAQKIDQLVSGSSTPSNPQIVSVSPNTGPTAGGTAVTISGTNFGSGDQVTFGSQPAAILSVTGSTIVVTTPPGAVGVVPVTVRAPNGTSSTMTFGFTYNTAPPPPPNPGVSWAPGFPVIARVTAQAGKTISVTLPTDQSPGIGNRLLVAALIWNTRSLANPGSVRITDPNGAYFYDVGDNAIGSPGTGAIFGSAGSPSAPGHEGSRVVARYMNGSLPSGYTVTATFDNVTTMDAMLVVYMSTNPLQGNSLTGDPGGAIGVGASAADATGTPGPEAITLAAVTQGSGIIVAVQDGTGASGITPLANCTSDAQYAPLTSMMVARVPTAPAGNVPVGGAGTATYYTIDALEIFSALPSPPPSPGACSPGFVTTAGGQIVTLFGSAFQPGAAVSVVDSGGGTTPCVTTYVDSGTLQFTAPAHSQGVFGLQVKNPDGQIGTVNAILTFSDTAAQIALSQANAVTSTPQRTAPQNRVRGLSRVQSMVDPAVNRAQDQIISVVNPALLAIAEMPEASNGVFKSQDPTNLNLLNGWQTYQRETPAYQRDASGWVVLYGGLTAGTVGTIAAILPKGYRPFRTITIPTTNGSADAKIAIGADGSITPVAGDQAKGISLDNVSFIAQQE